MRLCNVIVILALSSNPLLQAYGDEPADNLSLENAVSLSLEANPEIAIVLRERSAIEGTRIQAAARPNPSISTAIETTRNATQKTLIQLNQPFELGDKRAARLEAADARYNAATAGINAKKSEIRANVISVFYEVLAAQERLSLAQTSMDIAGQARDATSKRVLAGKISPVEETKSRVAESTVKIELNQAKSALNTARKKLASLWGSTMPRFAAVIGDINLTPELLPFDTLAAKLEESPAIRLAQLEIETRQALANIENTRRTPDITVSVGVQRNEELGSNQAVLGLTVPIPVFDRNQGNLQEALSRTDKARDELTALRIQLDATLADKYERLRSSTEATLTLQTEILPGAQSAFEAASKGFLYGKFSYLEVLDAQRTLFQAKNQYLNTIVEVHQATADIERILGEVMPLNKTRAKTQTKGDDDAN